MLDNAARYHDVGAVYHDDANSDQLLVVRYKLRQSAEAVLHVSLSNMFRVHLLRRMIVINSWWARNDGPRERSLVLEAANHFGC